MTIIFTLIFIILIYPINLFIQKLNLLPNTTGEVHQIFVNKAVVPLSGGLFILISIFFTFETDLILYSFLFSFFLIGIASDKKIISSPKIKFLLQLTLVISFVLIFDLRIEDVRNNYFSTLLENQYISYFFIILCLLVLINGSNFIDGLNGLKLGYYLIIILILFKNNFLDLFNFSFINQILFITILIYLIFLNFINKLFSGDSGSYVMSVFIGYLLINIYSNNQNISPFFIALLLWYPCFENLFSILRKFNFKLSPLKPDSSHLHQLVFLFIKNKYKLKSLSANNLSSILINLFNLIIIYCGSLKYNHTITQIILIGIMSVIYIKVYLIMYNKAVKY